MENDTINTQQMSISSRDVLTDILRQGAQKMLAEAIENEVAEYLDRHACVRDDRCHRLVIRNGHLPARTIQTGIGSVEVRQPRVNDKRLDENGQRIRFSSKILPPYYIRLEDPGNNQQRILVLMGATADGRKELIAITDEQDAKAYSIQGQEYAARYLDGPDQETRRESDRVNIRNGSFADRANQGLWKQDGMFDNVDKRNTELLSTGMFLCHHPPAEARIWASTGVRALLNLASEAGLRKMSKQPAKRYFC
jgi:hypothetical protein